MHRRPALGTVDRGGCGCRSGGGVHVGAGHAPLWPRARYRRQIDSSLSGDPASQRGGLRPRGAVRDHLGARSRLAEQRDQRSDPDALTLGSAELQHGPPGLGLVHHARLVGLHLDERLPLVDVVPGPHEPPHDRALLHRVRQPGHDDFESHVIGRRDPPRSVGHNHCKRLRYDPTRDGERRDRAGA